MANVVIGKVEVVLEDVLHFFAKVQTVVLKGPQIIVSLTVLLTAVDKVINDVQLDVANPVGLINVPMDAQQLADVKAIWPDIKAVFASAGFKF